MEEPKLTEFNSNLACLIRIDSLMKTAHQSSLGLIPMVNNKIMYCKTLLRLYKEGKSKFSKEEKKECENYKKDLIWAISLNPNNSNTLDGRIIIRADDFEDYLIDCLDKHNMLMAEKDRRLAASKTG